MAAIINYDDLPASIRTHELADMMVAGANAKASRIAPCLVTAVEAATITPEQESALDEARIILMGAVKRWADAGSGALSSRTAGPFAEAIDTRQRTGYNLWPSEISALTDICKSLSGDQPGRAAFSIDTAPASSAHLPWCSLSMGATYCSCGVDIAGVPIYELG